MREEQAIANVADLSKTQRSILLYAESCLVDHGGLLEGVRMNNADHAELAAFKADGLLDFGRIPGKLLGNGKTHWVVFTEQAWALAAGCRKLRSEQLGPYARSVFDEIRARATGERKP